MRGAQPEKLVILLLLLLLLFLSIFVVNKCAQPEMKYKPVL